MKFSEKHKLNISQAKKGQTAWNKGGSLSEAQKDAVSLAQRKLSASQVKEILLLIEAGEMPQRAIAEKFGVCPATITGIKKGDRRYVTFS